MANRKSTVPRRDISLHALWRDAVLATNEHTCVCCGETEKTTVIQAHHILEYVQCPALGYEPLNCVILCCRCHAHLHSGRPDLSDPLNATIKARVPDRIAFIEAHRNDPCPDYGNSTVRAALRKRLRAMIPADYVTYGRLYDLQHRADHSAHMQEWYAAHKEEHNQRSRKWYLAHKEKAKELSHAWYEAHKADVCARTRAYAAARREKYREYQRKYRAAHKDAANARNKQYRERLKLRQQEAAQC